MNFFYIVPSRLSRPEKISEQSRLSHGTGQTGFLGIRDCPADLYSRVIQLGTDVAWYFKYDVICVNLNIDYPLAIV